MYTIAIILIVIYLFGFGYTLIYKKKLDFDCLIVLLLAIFIAIHYDIWHLS